LSRRDAHATDWRAKLAACDREARYLRPLVTITTLPSMDLGKRSNAFKAVMATRGREAASANVMLLGFRAIIDVGSTANSLKVPRFAGAGPQKVQRLARLALACLVLAQARPHRVADLVASHLRADRRDPPSDIVSDLRGKGALFAQAFKHADCSLDLPPASALVCVCVKETDIDVVQASSVHLDQHFVWTRRRNGQASKRPVGQIRISVSLVDQGLHGSW
jgi:hypothetical protein